MARSEKSDSGRQLEKLRSTRNGLGICAALIAGSTMLKSEGIFSMGFIPNWASWILAAFCLCAATFFALKVTHLESR